ncbi:ABC transporter substrate-binding protein [Streptomyces sp. VTCC 41912]|uniref:ABC transporter substrate-binding protein n=1 Tax=Streptomyces sp. VTCC 41912 TaxID=3383243 RepID=UPI003896D88E
MKRRFVGALLIPFALLATACGGKSADARTSTTLDVGDQTGGDRAMLEASGELKDLPYKINWSTFASGPLLLEALNAKAIDLGWTGNTPPVFAASSGSKITVVGAMHSSVAGTAILVPHDSPLKSVQDLKGKKIAVMQGTTGHDLLLAALKRAGLSIHDVNVGYLQSAEAKTAFKRGDVDAWAAADPTTTQALDGDHARVPSARTLPTGGTGRPLTDRHADGGGSPAVPHRAGRRVRSPGGPDADRPGRRAPGVGRRTPVGIPLRVFCAGQDPPMRRERSP